MSEWEKKVSLYYVVANDIDSVHVYHIIGKDVPLQGSQVSLKQAVVSDTQADFINVRLGIWIRKISVLKDWLDIYVGDYYGFSIIVGGVPLK